MIVFGCDTFVVLPPLTANGDIIFGKNSDRPNGEVQEILFNECRSYKEGDRVQCTYIEIDQVSFTYAVLLSKPSWMWGAEMGANSCGVVIGNEAVWTVVGDESHTERLLGMDLLRLGLERSSSSREAVSVITSLLEKYGQGGPCSDIDPDLLYHNSFLISDHKEVWVLETAGRLWAAEQVTNGYRNISNCLSIGTNISLMSDELLTYAKEQKLWNGKSEFSFKDVFSSGGCPREAADHKLLADLTNDSKFDVQRMFQVLRDKKSGICRPANDPFHTSGSWVSVINGINRPSCHWVTGTPDPSVSFFKPFVFSPNPNISPHITSPTFKNDPAKVKPRFQFVVNRKHTLYSLAEGTHKSHSVLKSLQKEEETMVKNVFNILSKIESESVELKSCDDLLKNYVDLEMMLYETQHH